MSFEPPNIIRWTSTASAELWFEFKTEELVAAAILSNTDAEFRARLRKMGSYVHKNQKSVKAVGR